MKITQYPGNIRYSGVDIYSTLFFGKQLASLYGFNHAVFDLLITLEEVVNSAEAMAIIAASPTCMTDISKDVMFCSAIKNSTIAITALDNSSPAIVPTMTGFSTPSGVVIESSEYGGAPSQPGYYAFDKNENTYWSTSPGAAGNSLAYNFLYNVWCYKVRIVSYNDYSGLSTGRVQYSLNGTTWYDAASVAMNGESTKVFNVCAPVGKVPYWRLFCDTNRGSSYLYIHELQFYCK